MNVINNGITRDITIHQLSDDSSRLAFTWLITFADCEGRTRGDPSLQWSLRSRNFRSRGKKRLLLAFQADVIGSHQGCFSLKP